MSYDQVLIDEIKTISQIRAAFYSYFSKVFREPVAEDFIGLTEKYSPHFEEFAGFSDSDLLKSSVDTLKLYVALEQSSPIDEHLNNLNRQFTSIFLLGRSSVPTSASVYISVEKLLKREPWEKVCDVYRLRGFKLPENFNEPEDHISMETLYLKKMSDLVVSLIEKNTLDNIEEILKEHKEFIDDNVLTWVEDFTALTVKQSNAAGSHLYGPVAILMAEFLKYDSELFNFNEPDEH